MSGAAFAGVMLGYVSGIAAAHSFFLGRKYPRIAVACWLFACAGMVGATMVSQ